MSAGHVTLLEHNLFFMCTSKKRRRTTTTTTGLLFLLLFYSFLFCFVFFELPDLTPRNLPNNSPFATSVPDWRRGHPGYNRVLVICQNKIFYLLLFLKTTPKQKKKKKKLLKIANDCFLFFFI